MTGPREPATQVQQVTVGVFAYNHEAFIAEAIQSVLTSEPTPCELIVVDDGSTDGTATAIQSVIGGRTAPSVRVIADGQNVGLAARLNQVLGLTRTPWLAILGGDDAYLPDGLARLAAGAGEDVDVVWGDLIVMDQSGHPKGYARPRDTWQGGTARKYVRPGPVGNDILRVNNFVSGTSTLVRVRAVQAAGG